MQLLKFLFFFFVVSGVLCIAAVAWPRFMGDSQRPEFLNRIYNAIRDTNFGKQTASVLGVSEQLPVEPLTIQGFTTNLVQTALQSAGNQAQSIITTQAVNQLMSQFDQLPVEKQQLLQQIVCRPVSYTDATMSAEIEQ